MYFILDGVRRSVAALAVGRSDIEATLVRPGQPDLVMRLPLADLISPKSTVPRDFRYVRYTEYPTVVLGTEPPPIRVRPATPADLAGFTPLRLVRLM